MSRNLLFTGNFLYMVTKKLHKLVQIDLAQAVQRIKSDQKSDGEAEGKVLEVEVTDFVVEKDGSVWTLTSDSTVEKLGANISSRC